jgi:hypothetical protein
LKENFVFTENSKILPFDFELILTVELALLLAETRAAEAIRQASRTKTIE